MKLAITSLVAAGILLATGVPPTHAADTKTWYVYCEGNRQDDHWAVFSENFWPHAMTEGYGRAVASAAKEFFESRHNVQLDGCAGVNFVDSSLAEHSRSRTAQLHKKMGDRVFFFPLPNEAMPLERRADAEAQVVVGRRVAGGAAAGGAAPAAVAKAGEPQEPSFTPRHAER